MARHPAPSPPDIGRQCAGCLAGHRQRAVELGGAAADQKPRGVQPCGSRSTGARAARCGLLTIGSGRVTCRPAANGESPAMTRHPAWGRSSWHAWAETRQAYQGRRAVTQKPDVRLRRIYDDPADDDGIRRPRGSTMAEGSEQGAGRTRRMVHPGRPVGRAAQVVRTRPREVRGVRLALPHGAPRARAGLRATTSCG